MMHILLRTMQVPLELMPTLGGPRDTVGRAETFRWSPAGHFLLHESSVRREEAVWPGETPGGEASGTQWG